MLSSAIGFRTPLTSSIRNFRPTTIDFVARTLFSSAEIALIMQGNLDRVLDVSPLVPLQETSDEVLVALAPLNQIRCQPNESRV